MAKYIRERENNKVLPARVNVYNLFNGSEDKSGLKVADISAGHT